MFQSTIVVGALMPWLLQVEATLHNGTLKTVNSVFSNSSPNTESQTAVSILSLTAQASWTGPLFTAGGVVTDRPAIQNIDSCLGGCPLQSFRTSDASDRLSAKPYHADTIPYIPNTAENTAASTIRIHTVANPPSPPPDVAPPHINVESVYGETDSLGRGTGEPPMGSKTLQTLAVQLPGNTGAPVLVSTPVKSSSVSSAPPLNATVQPVSLDNTPKTTSSGILPPVKSSSTVTPYGNSSSPFTAPTSPPLMQDSPSGGQGVSNGPQAPQHPQGAYANPESTGSIDQIKPGTPITPSHASHTGSSGASSTYAGGASTYRDNHLACIFTLLAAYVCWDRLHG